MQPAELHIMNTLQLAQEVILPTVDLDDADTVQRFTNSLEAMVTKPHEPWSYLAHEHGNNHDQDEERQEQDSDTSSRRSTEAAEENCDDSELDGDTPDLVSDLPRFGNGFTIHIVEVYDATLVILLISLSGEAQGLLVYRKNEVGLDVQSHTLDELVR